MPISIKPVNPDTLDAVLALSVAPEQRRHIETTRECLSEAAQSPNWRPVGLYAKGNGCETIPSRDACAPTPASGDTLIGFAMYGRFNNWISGAPEARVCLDRLLIDSRFQGHGYGDASLRLLLARIKSEYACNTVYLSVYGDNARAIALYEKYGFRFNGELDAKGEKVMVAKV